jgi:hypothetical protein
MAARSGDLLGSRSERVKNRISDGLDVESSFGIGSCTCGQDSPMLLVIQEFGDGRTESVIVPWVDDDTGTAILDDSSAEILGWNSGDYCPTGSQVSEDFGWNAETARIALENDQAHIGRTEKVGEVSIIDKVKEQQVFEPPFAHDPFQELPPQALSYNHHCAIRSAKPFGSSDQMHRIVFEPERPRVEGDRALSKAMPRTPPVDLWSDIDLIQGSPVLNHVDWGFYSPAVQQGPEVVGYGYDCIRVTEELGLEALEGTTDYRPDHWQLRSQYLPCSPPKKVLEPVHPLCVRPPCYRPRPGLGSEGRVGGEDDIWTALTHQSAQFSAIAEFAADSTDRRVSFKRLRTDIDKCKGIGVTRAVG